MKDYIITILGAAVLCGSAHILTPQSWIKYVKIITGLVILSVIASPLTTLFHINIFSDFSVEESYINENLQTEVIAKELKKRVEQDINERIQSEFSHTAKAEVIISINEEYEITGVSHIKIATNADKAKVTQRMCEIYGTKKEEVEIYDY